MSAGILLECVSPISWVWKFLWVWVWVWIWKIFCGVLDFYVGHGIFFFFFFFCWTCRNFFLDMEFFWNEYFGTGCFVGISMIG